MKSHLHLNIRIKAKDKLMKWDVVLNPVFFMYHNAFEVKVVEGPLSSSIFCCKISDFEYNWYAKLQIWFIWKIYWCRNVFWRYVRYQFPAKVRRYFKNRNQKGSDDLPFQGVSWHYHQRDAAMRSADDRKLTYRCCCVSGADQMHTLSIQH